MHTTFPRVVTESGRQVVDTLRPLSVSPSEARHDSKMQRKDDEMTWDEARTRKWKGETHSTPALSEYQHVDIDMWMW